MLYSRPTTMPAAIITYIILAYTLPPIVDGSRAYPHGCLYRHPSYYTYDERDDITWSSLQAAASSDDESTTDDTVDSSAGTESYIDFRYLPSKSSTLRRPYTRYRLIKRLGAGKFSDVFEAVDIQWDDSSSTSEQGNEILNVKKGGKLSDDTTEELEDEVKIPKRRKDKEDEEIDIQSLVVLKCLKPVSERKIRRELLVLTHCISLPNLARVRFICVIIISCIFLLCNTHILLLLFS